MKNDISTLTNVGRIEFANGFFTRRALSVKMTC
jgi:hypothetical protein